MEKAVVELDAKYRQSRGWSAKRDERMQNMDTRSSPTKRGKQLKFA
jgi:hypothetical protein